MFNYEICNVEDEDVFFRQCKALEKNISNISKGEFIEADLLMQEYMVAGKTVKVICDWTSGVTINSEIELEQFFNN